MITPLVNARAKIVRAKQHIKELERCIATFVRDGYYTWSIKDDLERKAMVLKIKTKPLPADIPLIMGDIFHCLRTALDQALFELIKPEPKKIRRVQFPVVDEGESLTSTSHYGLIEESIPLVAELIRDKINPTQRGNPTLWGLHRMDIIDKHRALVVVSNVAVVGLPVAVSYTRGSMFMDNKFIMQMGQEQEVFIGHSGSEVYGEPKLTFKIFIGESEAFTHLEIGDVTRRCVACVDVALGVLEGRNPYTFRRR